METKIIGFSGKLQSGKDSACNMLYAIALVNILKLTEKALVNDDGKLVIDWKDPETNQVLTEVFDIDSKHPEVVEWLSTAVWPFIKKYSFAEILKSFCEYVLAVPTEGVWGSNEDKNKPVEHLLWENVPVKCYTDAEGNKYYETDLKQSEKNKLKLRTGPMTGREVMEYFGTNICRKWYPDIWANSLVKSIETFKPTYALVNDVRFPNEVEAIKKAGGKVVRLTLDADPTNKHISNTALDKDVYDWDNFDFVLDNQNMTMEEAHSALIEKLVEWEYLKGEEVEIKE